MFPSIVSTSIYEQAQAIRVNKQVKRTPSANLLKQKIKCPYCGSTLTNMAIRKTNHSLRYYVCPKNMNASRFICDFKGINAENLEKQVLESCKNSFETNSSIRKSNMLLRNSSKNKGCMILVTH